MNAQLLHTEVQQFIDEHLNSDPATLILKGSPFTTLTIREIVEQIESKNRARIKLPTWFTTKCIYYPNKLNLSQSSSEQTAAYKSGIIDGTTLLDLTGGFGVDSYYFSKHFSKVISCEIDRGLAEIVRHNFKQLGCEARIVSENGLEYVKKLKIKVDWMYLDPSRRSDSKQKVFLLEDCSPNIVSSKSRLFEYTDNILVKASPLLDISSALEKLTDVCEVHCVAVSNEVKELLLVLKKDYKGAVALKTVDIKKTGTITFDAVYGAKSKVQFALPKTYLYEPNAAVLKAGLFNEVSTKLELYKLHNNSHLYTNDSLIHFPGRRFKIRHETTYDAKKIKGFLPEKKAHITTRNFPDSVAEIRKKIKFSEGGQHYLFFTTNIDEKLIVLICEKL